MKPGTRLGPYEILEPLGSGGMGEVWLAEDTRLHRKVAVKVLPAEFAADPERLARFGQEARAAAALNHPHIAVVHDVGSEKGVHFMVQEHLRGQTLGEHLGAKGAMQTKKALDLAAEIGEALRAAHGAGIIHRDLKPANIFVAEDGHAKVLDFGLAKLTEMAAVGTASGSRSPTMLGTVAGQVMGTAGYMAPEQIEGGEIDPRTDLFAFGCVLYEMSTGQRAFAGKNLLDTLHRIANSEPRQLAEVSDQLPADLQRIVRKCLAKDPSERYQTAGDLTVDLRALATEVERGTAVPLSAITAAMPQPASLGTGPKSSSHRRTTTGMVAMCLVGVALGAATVWSLSDPDPPESTRFEITLPEGYVLSRGLAFSPDGRQLVFAGTDPEGRQGLFRRKLGELETEFITGSEGGQLPIFSPNGEWIVFNSSPRLLKIPAAGGEPLELASHGQPIFSSWAPGNSVVYENRGVISRVSSAGGTAEILADEGNDPRYDHPFALDDGRHILITVSQSTGTSVAVLDGETGTIRTLVDDATGPGYLPTGHLTFGRDGAVWAQPFDLDTLEVSGTPFPLRPGVSQSAGQPQLATSPGGSMAYVPGDATEAADSLVWLDSDGNWEVASTAAPGFVASPRLSPNERFVAMTVSTKGDRLVFTYDMRRSTFTLLGSRDQNAAESPVWTPDGAWIYYTLVTDGEADIYRARADRSSPPEPFLRRDGIQYPADVSPDGKHLLFTDTDAANAAPDTWVVGLDGGDPEPFLAGSFPQVHATFSPDGAWVAFISLASGQPEVYVTPYPGPGRTLQVSNDTGLSPVWAKDGSRLYYRHTSGSLLAAEIVAGSDLEFDAPRTIVPEIIIPRAFREASFDVAADGRIIMSDNRLSPTSNNSERPTIDVTLAWFEVVRRLAPTR